MLATDHPDVATSLNNLAELLEDQVRVDPLEGSHIPTIAGVNCLEPKGPLPQAIPFTTINLLANQDNFEEAEGLYKRSLALLEERLGPDHPEVADGLNNLAGLLQSLVREWI